MNYGTLVIVDGVYQPPQSSPEGRRGFARLERGNDGALRPPVLMSKPGSTTFVVDLFYNERAYLYGGWKNPTFAGLNTDYSRSVRRLAPGGNPLAAAKRVVSEYAGCDEAHKVRGRAIALSRIRKTISGEVFRFPLEAPRITSDGGNATASVSVSENTTAVTIVKATASASNTRLAYSIADGLDSALFSINTSNGSLRFASPPDYENPLDYNGDNVYEVTVIVAIKGGLSTSQKIRVTVTNVNEVGAVPDLSNNPLGAARTVGVETIEPIGDKEIASKEAP